MAEATADGTPIVTTNLDIAMVGGGYQLGDSSEVGGGGGPTAAEVEIENIYASWSAPIVGGDGWTAYMADGAMFFDPDDNGYYDHLEIGVDGGVCIYDPATDSWLFRAY